MKGLLCRILGHSIETVKTNDYQVPTHERCMHCRLERVMRRDKDSNCLQWHYSDGRVSVGYPVFHIDDVKFGNLS